MELTDDEIETIRALIDERNYWATQIRSTKHLKLMPETKKFLYVDPDKVDALAERIGMSLKGTVSELCKRFPKR